MDARQLFQAGKLNEAVRALGEELRANPADTKRRTFLFELLCFAGEFDRADKQLDVLSGGGRDAGIGTLLYRAAIAAERTRTEMFRERRFPGGEVPAASGGVVNGQPFLTFSDLDPRIGSRLEIYAAGNYMWIPAQHVTSLEIPPPKRLRDLLWTPAVVQTSEAFKVRDLGEVLVPVLAPLSFEHPDDQVRLGRSTVFDDVNGEQVPFGQKLFVIDGEEVPLLEVRRIEFVASKGEPHAASA